MYDGSLLRPIDPRRALEHERREAGKSVPRLERASTQATRSNVAAAPIAPAYWQVKELAAAVQAADWAKRITTVVVSPLTRALATALGGKSRARTQRTTHHDGR